MKTYSELEQENAQLHNYIEKTNAQLVRALEWAVTGVAPSDQPRQITKSWDDQIKDELIDSVMKAVKLHNAKKEAGF
jgi:hypothetical protein